MVLVEMGGTPEDRIDVPNLADVESYEYSEEFRERIRTYLRGMEGFPKYEEFVRDQLGGPDGRMMHFVRYLIPEIEYRCGPLRDKRVLDFGCGAGSSTAALATRCKSLVAFDVDIEGIEACRLRLEEHGLEDRVELYCTSSLDDVKAQIGSVDLVLMCGVIEHIPLSDNGARRTTIRTLFEMLNAPGYMYIYDTPNRVWPYDFHTTGLWWIPWAEPGSRRAYERAVRAGRFMDFPRVSQGPRGLEQCGAWGATYWELRDYLDGEDVRCLNTLPGNNKHIDYLGGARRFQLVRYPFDFFVGLVARPFRLPITAFYPFLDNLVFMKPGPNGGP